MARAKRWTLPFKSLAGIDCRVDIYKEGYTGSTVDTLTGATDPFYYEEGADNDLLNNVIRYRTGYINVMEETAGALQDLYPTNFFDRYVEFYYGSTLEFTGYIQVQEMTNAWTAPPTVISLPVISPLGLLDKGGLNRVFQPTSVTLGSLLDQVITGLKASYTKVFFPYNNAAPGLWMEIFSLVVSPWNEDFHHSSPTTSYLAFMARESYQYLVEGICKAFGWIAHDTPQGIVFSMFDWQAFYYSYPVGHIGDNSQLSVEASTSSPLALTNYLTYADNNAEQSTILPYKSIRVEYEGDDLDNIKVSFDRCVFLSVTGYGSTERTSVANLYCPTGELNPPGSQAVFDSDHHIASGTYIVALNGSEGILISLSGTETSGSILAKARYYVKTMGTSWTSQFNLQTGSYIANLTNNDDIYTNLVPIVTVNADYVEVSFQWIPPQDPAEIPQLIFIKNIEFIRKVNTLPYADYQTAPTTSGDRIPDGAPNNEDETVTMPFSLYRFNQNMIGSTLWTTKFTSYPYLLAPRNKLVATFKGTLPALFHAYSFTYWMSGWRWRIIAAAFYPWDDERRITMQRSQTLES